MEEKVLLEWKALNRPSKQWSKDFYSTVIVLAFLVSVILFFIEGFLPVLVVWAVVFLMWSMNRLPSVQTNYQVTSWGIKADGGLTRWEEMSHFWLESRWGSRLLRVAIFKMPWNLVYVINSEDEKKLSEILANYLTFNEPVPGLLDKMVKWLGEKMPLD